MLCLARYPTDYFVALVHLNSFIYSLHVLFSKWNQQANPPTALALLFIKGLSFDYTRLLEDVISLLHRSVSVGG